MEFSLPFGVGWLLSFFFFCFFNFLPLLPRTVTLDIQVVLDSCPPTHHQIETLTDYYCGLKAFDFGFFIFIFSLYFVGILGPG